MNELRASDDVQPPPPSDYQLLLPEGWFRILLEPHQRERSVEALVKRQFNGVDDAPHLRRLLREELLARATDAFDEGGIELYISLQQAGALTIPASLLITLVRPRRPGAGLPSPTDLAQALGAESGAGQTISVIELAAGTAMRVQVDPEETPTGTQRSEDQYELPSLTVDYQLAIPHTDAHLLLTFSTPLIQIADAMADLFGAIAGSLKWQGATT